MKKVLFLLVTLFLIQFAISCNPCNCPDTSYDVIYDGINFNPINTSKFHPQVIEDTDTIYRNTFALQIALQYNLEERTGMIMPSSYGFSSAMACQCDDLKLFYPDAIRQFKIFVINSSYARDGFPILNKLSSLKAALLAAR